MKLKFMIIFVALLLISFFGCNDLTGGLDDTTTFTPSLSLGDSETVQIGVISFKMKGVPGTDAGEMPLGVNDSEVNSGIVNSFWIGESEVTYEVWDTIYTWAISNGYAFSNTGTQGYGAGSTDKHPVTTVNWRDAMVFCNAVTEWYNFNNTEDIVLECVYFTDSEYNTPHRDSSDGSYGDSVDTTVGSFDSPYVKIDATGFRLPTNIEWECAARYIDGSVWLNGDHASGDISGACYDDGAILDGQSISIIFGDYAWYQDNNGTSTHVVGTAGSITTTEFSGNANGIGCYDMSGNVRELCNDWFPGYVGMNRTFFGGSFLDSSGVLRVGNKYGPPPFDESVDVGFRLSRRP